MLLNIYLDMPFRIIKLKNNNGGNKSDGKQGT